MLASLAAVGCRSAAPTAPPSGGASPAAAQHLFRAEIEARGEGGSLRLTLRRWRADRFELVARDLAGRALWRLEVDGALGRLSGSAAERSCRFAPAAPISLPRFDLALSADALPDLLLGRLPGAELEPAADADAAARDARGRLWRVDSKDGLVVGWRLLRAPEAPDLIWRRERDGFRLESADGALTVRWRETARAAPAPAPTPLALDPALADCRDLDLS